MKLFKKIYWLIYPFLIVVFMLLLGKVFKVENTVLQTGVSVFLAFFLSPKIIIVEKLHGSEEQIKWLFFKRVINTKP